MLSNQYILRKITLSVSQCTESILGNVGVTSVLIILTHITGMALANVDRKEVLGQFHPIRYQLSLNKTKDGGTHV
jgi:hypothetical protein